MIDGQKPYVLTQFMLPFGAGVKFAVSDDICVGVEFSQCKTFTDYLDDLSTHYGDPGVLLHAKRPKAAALACRGDELPNGSVYPPPGNKGTPLTKWTRIIFSALH